MCSSDCPIEAPSASRTLVGSPRADVRWGGFDEHTACGLCYTSGTTGNPKGVLYSHRSNFLHALVHSAGRRHGPVRAATRAAGGADVPRQRLGPRLLLPRRRRPSWSCRARRWTAPRSTSCWRPRASPSPPPCPPSGRCCCSTCKRDGRKTHDPEAGRDRRLGGARGAHPRLPRRLWRRRHPRLGHDRDLAAGHPVHPDAGGRGPVRSTSRCRTS